MRVAKKSVAPLLTVVPPQDEKTIEAIAELDEFIGTRASKKRPPSITDKAFTIAATEVMEMMRTGDWSKAKPVHFVALYAHEHAKTYRVEAFELNSRSRFYASRLVAAMLKARFEEPAEMAVYMKWVWDRERWREEHTRANKIGGSRIGWNLMFNGTLYTDFRMAQLKRHGK